MAHFSPYQEKLLERLYNKLGPKQMPVFPSIAIWITPEFFESLDNFKEKCKVCGKLLGIGDYVDHTYPYSDEDCLCAEHYEIEKSEESVK